MSRSDMGRTRRCKQCGGEFIATKEVRGFRCGECKKADPRNTNCRLPPGTTRPCAVCKTVFVVYSRGNPRCRTCEHERRKAYYAKNKDRFIEYTKQKNDRGHTRFYRYGVTKEIFDSAFSKQDGRCAICGKHMDVSSRKCCLDHDHKTGKFRGLLCTTCNWGLGHMKDSEELLLAAMKYLREARSA